MCWRTNLAVAFVLYQKPSWLHPVEGGWESVQFKWNLKFWPTLRLKLKATSCDILWEEGKNISKAFSMFIFSEWLQTKLVSSGGLQFRKWSMCLLTSEQDRRKLCDIWHVILTSSWKISRSSCPAAFLGFLLLHFAILITVNASLEFSSCRIRLFPGSKDTMKNDSFFFTVTYHGL